jgi:soluble lytic murein transglycosylase
LTISLVRAVSTALVIAAPALSLAASGSPQDEALRAARDAFEGGHKARFDRVAPKLKGGILEPYVEYWQLHLRLQNAPAAEIREFLSRYPDTALAEQMRDDWLKVLGKKGEWELFGAEYPALAGDDPEVTCYVLQSRRQHGDASATADFMQFWNAPRELPEGCVTLSRSMRKSGELGTREVWQRFRVLVNADLWSAARRLMEYLPRGEALDATRIRAAYRAPTRFLKGPRVDLAKVPDRELVIAALTQAADDDPKAAAGFWTEKFSEAFPPEDKSYVWKMLAVRGAQHHLPEALDWFSEAGDVALTDHELAWRARIALRQERWTEVRSSIERMSPLAKSDPAWTYWFGRAERALGEPLEAEGYFERIAGEHHFYGRLAADELGMRIHLPPKAAQPSEDEIAEVAALPGIQRALALYRADLRVEGTREWLWSIRGMDDRHLLAAAELARRNEVWDRAINTADRTVTTHDFALRYLAPYRDLLAEKARSRSLDEPWVLGLVRQESRFIADAKSPTGASGLMQVMRSTAKWVVMKIRMRNFSWKQLSEPEVNATLGTFYLRHVLDQFDGSPVVAAAAYNAGPTRARQWRGKTPVEGAIFAETIPFGETRDYVKKVMANTVYYAAVLGGREMSLKTRLGVVAPAKPVAPEVMAMRDEGEE